MPRGKNAKNQKKPIEQYDHKDKKRANNPPVGLVTPETDPPEPPKKTYAYDPHLDPQLVWSGKAERLTFEVPTVSLHVHERIDPRTIIEAVRKRNGNGGRSACPSGRQRRCRASERGSAEFRSSETLRLLLQIRVHSSAGNNTRSTGKTSSIASGD